MSQGSFIASEEQLRETSTVLERLLRESVSKCVYLVDKAGQLVAACGETKDIDATSLASLTAGNIAATGGLAKTIGEKEFSLLFHEGVSDHIHISLVAQKLILVVIFDKRSSIGLVRLRVKKACEELAKLIE